MSEKAKAAETILSHLNPGFTLKTLRMKKR